MALFPNYSVQPSQVAACGTQPAHNLSELIAFSIVGGVQVWKELKFRRNIKLNNALCEPI